MNVQGKAFVYQNEFKGKKKFSISDGSKNQDGTWTNVFYNVRFKGEQPTHKSQIEYKGFTSHFKADNGNVYTTIQITEWSYVGATQEVKQVESDPFSDYGNTIDISDDSLQF